MAAMMKPHFNNFSEDTKLQTFLEEGEEDFHDDDEPEDEPPPDDDEELTSLPSLHSDDDEMFENFNFEDDLLEEEGHVFDDYGEPLSDPESDFDEPPPLSDEEDDFSDSVSGGGQHHHHQHKERGNNSSQEADLLPLFSHPKYGKYFKMLKVGLPKEMVINKMKEDGILKNYDILDRNPNENLFGEICGNDSQGTKIRSVPPPPSAGVVGGVPPPRPPPLAPRGVIPPPRPSKTDISYISFFLFLSLSLSFSLFLSLSLSFSHILLFSLFLFLLFTVIPPPRPPHLANVVPPPRPPPRPPGAATGLPPPPPMTVTNGAPQPPRVAPPPRRQAMISAGGEDGPKIAVGEHPVYSKYFKMLKVGLPKNFVERKMMEDKIDPKFIHMEPSELVLIEVPPPPDSSSAEGVSPSFSIGARPGSGPGLPPILPKVSRPTLRKKKLFLKAIDSKHLGEDSIWNQDDDDEDGGGEGGEKDKQSLIDKEEFNRLFVEDLSVMANNAKKNLTEGGDADKMKKIKGVTLINVKRAQNAAIALARIKLSYQEIKKKILCLDSTSFSIEQLESLKEFLPTPEEVTLLRGYHDDLNRLGLCEKYMMTMIDIIKDAKIYLNTILYKLTYFGRWNDCKQKLNSIEGSCDSIKSSKKLRNVMKVILKIINELNSEEGLDGGNGGGGGGAGELETKGITVESLVKLSTIKAFDKKTSVLQYVIMVINRHNASLLTFPEELKNLNDIARLSLDNIIGEKNNLENELKGNITALKRILSSHQSPAVSTTSTTSVAAVFGDSLPRAEIEEEKKENYDEYLHETIDQFENKLKPLNDELNHRVSTLNNKFSNILVYFGEDAKLSCQEFFNTFSKFVNEFILTRDNYERIRQQELKKQQRAAAAAAKAASGGSGAGGSGGGEGGGGISNKPVIKVRRNSKLSRLVENNMKTTHSVTAIDLTAEDNTIYSFHEKKKPDDGVATVVGGSGGGVGEGGGIAFAAQEETAENPQNDVADD
jgi:hypothetical protein